MAPSLASVQALVFAPLQDQATSNRRAEDGPRRMVTKRQTRVFLIDGYSCKVEALADGQQFVAFAVHPDTKQPYRWLDSNPLDVPFTALPVVSEERILAFIAKADAVLAKY